MSPAITIVTPSYKQLAWLRLAIASVADQEGVEWEHVIQDAGTRGIQPFLHVTFPTLLNTGKLRLFTEKDRGMYDAVNRGLARSKADICAYLNCDEQYLPGALRQVVERFENDPKLDLLFAGTVVVDGKGEYICSRPPLRPVLRRLRAGRMYNLSSSIFFRARLFRQAGIWFEPELRIVGDREWLQRILGAGAKVATLGVTTSTFSDLGTNLALRADGARERAAFRGNRAPLSRMITAVEAASHRVHRLLAGHYSLGPCSYSIYTAANPDQRHTFAVSKPTGIWHSRLNRI